jgi:hypothetical protein
MSEELKNSQKIHANVSFGEGNFIAVTGIIGGVVLALGFSWIVLAHGQGMNTTLLVIFVLAGLLIGGTVAAASAVLGLVMPREVGGGGPGQINDWIRWGMERKNWTEKDWKDWADAGDESYADWSEPDVANWTLQDWKSWGEKMKAKYKGKSS